MKFNNRNVRISDSASIGKNVRIGDDTIIYDNVVIEDDTIISNNCVLGEPPSDYYRNIDKYENPRTIVGANSLIRSHCVIYAGSIFGEGLITGHNAIVRERSCFGKHCLISTFVDIQGSCTVGDFSRLYSNVHIAEKTKIGNFVFIFPFTIFTNDPLPPSNTIVGAEVGDYSVITVHCSILPGIKIGQHCLVGANSVVTRDLPDYIFAIGSPAKPVVDVRKIRSKETSDSMHYPWPNSFERGMPWETIGFQRWIDTIGGFG